MHRFSGKQLLKIFKNIQKIRAFSSAGSEHSDISEGSAPSKTGSLKYRAFSSAGSEHLPYKQRVGGSNPSTPTKRLSKKSATFFYMYTFYVLYSEKLGRYYIGSTGDDIGERLRRHNSNHKGFTGSANDWTIMYIESFETKTRAEQREREVKKWKSRKLVEKLIKGEM